MSGLKSQTSYDKGVMAEKLAADYLCERGYRIVKMRYKTRYGEIDIIAQSPDSLVFVEVKMRGSLGDSLYAVTPKTRRRIEQSALYYIAENPDIADYAMRFDVIACACDPKTGGISFEHLDNAWEAGT